MFKYRDSNIVEFIRKMESLNNIDTFFNDIKDLFYEFYKDLKNYIVVSNDLSIIVKTDMDEDQLALLNFSQISNLKTNFIRKKLIVESFVDDNLSDRVIKILPIVAFSSIEYFLLLILNKESDNETDLDRFIIVSNLISKHYENMKLRNMGSEHILKNELRKDFFITMNRELRTPLNTIIGYSNIIKKKIDKISLKENEINYFKKINSNSIQMLQVINELLDVSKIESGDVEINCENFDLDMLLIEQVAYLEVLAKKKNISVEYVNNDVNTVFLDRKLLSQVLKKIFKNANDYTENGKIQIFTKKICNDFFTITVKDSGIGIDKENLDKIFEKSFKVIERDEKKGLGLSISRVLAEKLHGSISVISEKDVGSEFIIRLPYYFENGKKIN